MTVAFKGRANAPNAAYVLERPAQPGRIGQMMRATDGVLIPVLPRPQSEPKPFLPVACQRRLLPEAAFFGISVMPNTSVIAVLTNAATAGDVRVGDGDPNDPCCITLGGSVAAPELRGIGPS
jgi:hypothetical protein